MKTSQIDTRGADSGERGASSQYLTFELGPETYAVPLLQVQEIRQYTPATRIPNAPSYVIGVINLRGAIIAVVDLRPRLGLPALNDEEQSIVVVANVGEKTYGLRADSVSDVTEIAHSLLQPPPVVATDAQQRFLSALAQVHDRVLILLDLSKIVDVEAIDRLAA